MKYELPAGMRDAMRLTQAGRLSEATALIQRVLGGLATASPNTGTDADDGLIIDSEATEVTAPLSLPPVTPRAKEMTPSRFLDAVYSGPEGKLAYKLYVPSGHGAGQAAALIVMLHGCTQTPEDFAAGTRMNALAEAHGCLVAWPAQTSAANPQRCWNWFNAKDQGRGGEPSLIAAVTRQVMETYSADPRRVYVAGLSAGGAEAAILAEAYPELYAAAGVHSGLPCGAARDVASAFTAMRQGPTPARSMAAEPGGFPVPVIVFHGDRDSTVHPSNGAAVAARAASSSGLREEVETGRAAGGRAWRRTLWRDSTGDARVEQWVIEGAGHAWSGGAPAGSYTDPMGPDASAEMLRFFLAHPRA